MRRGEICSLLRTNVNLEKRVALLPMTKNGSARGVPLSSKAVEVLKNLPERDGVDTYFKGRPDTITNAFADAIENARRAHLNGLKLQLKQRKMSQETMLNNSRLPAVISTPMRSEKALAST